MRDIPGREPDKRFRNSRRNRIDLGPAGIEDSLIVEKLLADYLQTRKHALAKVHKPSYHNHLGMILFDLLAAWESDPTMYIGYSRGMPNFRKGGCYWNYVRAESFPSKGAFLGLIDFLGGEAGLVENHIAKAGFRDKSSRMRATDRLIELFQEYGLDWTSIRLDPEADVILVRDDGKRLISQDDASGRDSIDVQYSEANLRGINERLQSTFINLNVTDDEYTSILARRANHQEGDSDDDDTVGGYREPLEFSNRSLRRIFSQGSFECGGRFYGGWWQGVPKEFRKFIEIDNEPTVEMDFSTNQPRIMYAEIEHEAPEDSYLLPGWPQEIREYAKKAFNQLVNSDVTSRNEKQWHRFAPNIVVDPLPANWDEIGKAKRDQFRRKKFEAIYGRPYADLLRDLLALHQPIDALFFSKAWGRIQRKDSDIAERIMTAMYGRENPIVVLPIHDSFIVKQRYRETLLNTMHEAFFAITGVEPRISIDDQADGLNLNAEREGYWKRRGQWERRYGQDRRDT